MGGRINDIGAVLLIGGWFTGAGTAGGSTFLLGGSAIQFGGAALRSFAGDENAFRDLMSNRIGSTAIRQMVGSLRNRVGDTVSDRAISEISSRANRSSC